MPTQTPEMLKSIRKTLHASCETENKTPFCVTFVYFAKWKLLLRFSVKSKQPIKTSLSEGLIISVVLCKNVFFMLDVFDSRGLVWGIRTLEGTANWLSKHVAMLRITKITSGPTYPPDHGALLPGALSGIGRSTVAVQKNITPEMTLIFHYSYCSIFSRRANYNTSERALSDKGKNRKKKRNRLEVFILFLMMWKLVMTPPSCLSW